LNVEKSTSDIVRLNAESDEKVTVSGTLF